MRQQTFIRSAAYERPALYAYTADTLPGAQL